MSKSDKIEQHYEKSAERKKRDAELVSSDDAPISGVPVEQARSAGAPGRNDPCHCGSSKKYKKCCGKAGAK